LKTIRGVGYRLDAIAAWLSTNDGCNCLACTTPPGPSRVVHGSERRRRPSPQP
jgi:hypothetical protein